MIALEAVQLRRLAASLLQQLGVDDFVTVADARELPDGIWIVDFEDRSPHTRFPVFGISVQQAGSRDETARELRLTLRDKLWICPLCQRPTEMRRIIDTDVFRVDCGQCGRFEIENTILDRFRLGYEERDEALIRLFQPLSNLVRHSARVPSLCADTWQHVAEAALARQA